MSGIRPKAKQRGSVFHLPASARIAPSGGAAGPVPSAQQNGDVRRQAEGEAAGQRFSSACKPASLHPAERPGRCPQRGRTVMSGIRLEAKQR